MKTRSWEHGSPRACCAGVRTSVRVHRAHMKAGRTWQPIRHFVCGRWKQGVHSDTEVGREWLIQRARTHPTVAFQSLHSPEILISLCRHSCFPSVFFHSTSCWSSSTLRACGSTNYVFNIIMSLAARNLIPRI